MRKDPLEVAHIHLVRHGEALHNVEGDSVGRDPPLTHQGHDATQNIQLPTNPDLVLISPMTRTIQTALNIFPFLREQNPFPIPVEIWPDLRETHNAECNKGLPLVELSEKFPQFDYSRCSELWDYPPHSIEAATIRAERVRKALKELSATYSNIVVITHRGFIAYLAKGRRFNTCETRCYRFSTDEETQNPAIRKGVNCDTLLEQDFGPTVLVLESDLQRDFITSSSPMVGSETEGA